MKYKKSPEIELVHGGKSNSTVAMQLCHKATCDTDDKMYYEFLFLAYADNVDFVL